MKALNALLRNLYFILNTIADLEACSGKFSRGYVD